MKATEFDGKIGLIIGDHPHNGSLAKCLGVEKTDIGWAMKFKDIHTGFEFFVFHGKHVSWKDIEPKNN